jgi:hypothetical protein
LKFFEKGIIGPVIGVVLFYLVLMQGREGYPEEFSPWFSLATTTTCSGAFWAVFVEGRGETTDVMGRRMGMKEVG